MKYVLLKVWRSELFSMFKYYFLQSRSEHSYAHKRICYLRRRSKWPSHQTVWHLISIKLFQHLSQKNPESVSHPWKKKHNYFKNQTTICCHLLTPPLPEVMSPFCLMADSVLTSILSSLWHKYHLSCCHPQAVHRQGKKGASLSKWLKGFQTILKLNALAMKFWRVTIKY